MFEYPQAIAKDTFPAYTPNDPPESPSEEQPTSERTGVATIVSDPEHRGTLALPIKGTYGITRLVVISGAKASTSRNEAQPLGEEDPVDPKPFCLAPGLDAPAIGWTTPNPKLIRELKLELFSANHTAAVATATWTPATDEENRLEKTPDEQLGCTGTVTWTKGLLTFDPGVAADFPDGLPTARHSPYLLRATVTKNDEAPVPGYPLVAETIFHVRVAKLELAWGGQDLLPATANGCDPKHDATWAAREKAVLDSLVKDNAAPKPDVVHRVVLDAPVVSGGGLNDFQAEHKLLWGEGPRVPLLVKALVRRADGTDAADPKATFGLKVLWDWEAPADLTWRRWLGKPEGDDTDAWKKTSLAADRAFFDKVIESAPRDPGLAPPGAANCPAAFGGRTRHKTADPDLPVFATDTALDWTVAQLGDGTKRRWTATSAFDGKKDPSATGVLFSPGRLPGDTYHVRAYLALPAKDPAKLALDVAEADLGDGKQTLFQHVQAEEEARRLPVASATFRVYRRLELIFGAFPTTVPQAWRDDTVKYYERAASLILDPKPIGALLDSFRDAAEYRSAHEAMYRTQAVTDTWDVDTQKKVTVPIQLQAHHAFVPPADANLADAREFLPMRDLNEYQTALKRTFKERGVWALDLSADLGPGNPEVVAGAAEGWLIGKASFGSAKTYLVLGKNGQPFAKDAELVVKAYAYDKTARTLKAEPAKDRKARIEAVRTLASTWLEPQVKGVNGTDERQVKVTIGTRSHTVTFKRSLGSTSTKITTEHKDGLRQLLVDAVKAHANGPFVITVEGKVAGTKDRKRTGGVRSILTGLLEDGTVVDAADAFNAFGGLPNALLSASTYNDAWTASSDFVWDALRRKWQSTKLTGKKGLVYLAFERRSQGDIHPAGASFAGDNLADLALAYSTNPGRFQKPRQGYVQPVPLLIHELGHSLFLQHATTRSFAVKAPAIPDNGDDEGHVRFSVCCMNYDPDPLSVELCALCLGKLMGWSFSPDAKKLRNAHLVPDVNAVDDDAAIDKAITYIDEDLKTSTHPAWLHLGAAYLLSRKTAVRDAMRKENKEADDKAYAFQKWAKKPRWKELKDKGDDRSRREAKEFDQLDAEYNALQAQCTLDKFEHLAARPHQRQAAAGLVARLLAAEEAYRAVDAGFQQPLGTSMLMALAQGHYRYGDVERGHELYAKLDARTQHRLDLGEVRWAKLPPEDVLYLPPTEVNDLATRFWHLTNKGKTSHEYKVTISLGDPDALFTAPATTAAGQAARLQVLGLLNRPLKHPKASEAFAFAWDYAETLLPGLQADPATVLKKAIKEYLVEGGELPVPSEVSKARVYGGFAVNNSQTAMMIQFPADKFPASKGYQEGKHADELPYSRYMLGGERWDVENAFADDNPALGKLPLTIKVEKRPLGGQWAAAPKGVRVYLELLPPGKLPAPTAIANPEAAKHPVAGGHSYYDQPVAPELRANPKKYLADLVESFEADDPSDPQAGNAHFMLGGKRGLVPGNVSEPLFSAIENVFCGTAAQRFGGLPKAGSGGVARDHQVCLETDASGLVHLTMAPSRVGGDAYRLRAYVGPPTRDHTGTDPHVAKDETGTLVRWRTLRVSRHVKVDGAANTGELPDYLKDGDYPKEKLTPHLGAVADLDLKGFLTQELARSYCELVLDPAAQTPSKLSALGPAILKEAKDLARDYDSLNRPNIPNAWSKKTLVSVFREEVPPEAWDQEKKVVRYTLGCPTPEKGTVTLRPRGKGLSDAIASDASGALGDLKGGLTKATLDYGTGVLTAEFDARQDGPGIDVCYFPRNYLDLDSLLVFPDRSPFLFNLRLPEDYNLQLGTKKFKKMGRDASRSPEASGYIRDGYMGVTKNWLSQALARAGHKGYLPGLSIFQAAALDTYDGLWGGIGKQQGKGVESAILLFGKASGDLYNRLALHEVSHGFYLQHAPGGDASGAKDHLHAKGTGDVCVMSYDDSNDGDHCGQCVASLRGMSVEHAPFVPDDA